MNGHAGLYGWGATTMGDGTVAIGDIWNRRVVHFDEAGNELGVLFTLARGINPYGIAADPVTNAIYVGSSQCCDVQVWGPDNQGVYQQLASIKYSKFHYPSRVAVAHDGTVYVDDMLANSIFGFHYSATTGGHLVGTFGVHGSGPGQFKQPRGMGFDGSNPPRLFVMDSFNYRVQVWQQNTSTDALTYLSTFGSHGTGPGQFIDDNSRGIAIDKANGWLYAVDADNNLVQKYDITTNPPGTFLLNIGGNGRSSNPICCATPVGKFSDGGREDAVDGNGNLWVGDMPNFRAQVFDSNGVSQFAVPSPTQLPNTVAFNFPHEVTIDAPHNIVVNDSHNFQL
jgi:DNA-binding beta-propeller fold protein YncE